MLKKLKFFRSHDTYIYIYMRIKQKLVLDENKLTSEKKNKVKDLHFVEMCIRTFHGNFLSEKQYIFFIFIQI